MKCFEIRRCSEEQRRVCYVWKSLGETPDDMDNVKCWVLKSAYQKENRELLHQCLRCKYYMMMNRESQVVTDYDADVALIRCEGVLNNEKTRGLNEVWAKLKAEGRVKALLDLSEVNNAYSCALGAIVKIHKEAREAGGLLVIAGVQGYVQATMDSTKLSRILRIAEDRNGAREKFERFESARKKPEIPRAAEAPRPRPQCWEYFQNHNPRNATTCDECFRKVHPTDKPCWLVEGMIEGISFQYVNEDCEECEYFLKFGTENQDDHD